MRILFLVFMIIGFAAPANAQAPEGSSLREQFIAANGRTMRVLLAEFPQDHAAVLAHLDTVEAGNDSQMVRLSAGFDAVTAVRRKYADRLQFAGPQVLTSLLLSAATFHEAVLAGEGPGGCAAFAQNGTGVLFQLGRADRYAALIDRQSALYFEAVAAAIERPEVHGESQPTDLATVLALMGAAGAPEAHLAAILTGQPTDPGYCPGLIALFRAAAVFEAPEGIRVRADLARNLAGY